MVYLRELKRIRNVKYIISALHKINCRSGKFLTAGSRCYVTKKKSACTWVATLCHSLLEHKLSRVVGKSRRLVVGKQAPRRLDAVSLASSSPGSGFLPSPSSLVSPLIFLYWSLLSSSGRTISILSSLFFFPSLHLSSNPMRICGVISATSLRWFAKLLRRRLMPFLDRLLHSNCPLELSVSLDSLDTLFIVIFTFLKLSIP